MILNEDAINSLIPNTEWHYRAGVLTIFTEGVTAPSSAEIAAEKVRLTEVLAQQEEAKAAQKAALLDRLGITEDEAKLLLA
jgi:hypothetical protein